MSVANYDSEVKEKIGDGAWGSLQTAVRGGKLTADQIDQVRERRHIYFLQASTKISYKVAHGLGDRVGGGHRQISWSFCRFLLLWTSKQSNKQSYIGNI